jgi:pimeloyl-ACP methyl ester carboxylesterase
MEIEDILSIRRNINCFIYRNLTYILYSILTISLILSPSLINSNYILANERKPLIYPLKGKILVHFNEQYVDEDTGETHRHCGIDIAGNEGDRAIASAPGKVFYVGWTPTGGKTISICHLLNVKTTYLNLQDYHVSVGQEVKRGQVIGTIGAEDDLSNEEVHLHFGVIVNNHYVDPEKILEMDFNDLTKYISLTYTELDEGMNVEVIPSYVEAEKLNHVADKNSNNIMGVESFPYIDLGSFSKYSGGIYKLDEDEDDFRLDNDSHSILSDIRDFIFRFFHLDNDNDGIVFTNDPDDDNDGTDDKYEFWSREEIEKYTSFEKSKDERGLKKVIHNKFNDEKDNDYKLIIGGFCGETYDVKKSKLWNFLINNGYNESIIAYFSWNGPGTYHNGYDSQGRYENFKESMVAYLNKIPEGKKIDLMGHSQGGVLILRFVLDKNNEKYMKKINQVITINSPIKGANSFLAGIMFEYPSIGKILGFLLPDKNFLPFPEMDPDLPALSDLSPESCAIKKLAYPDEYGDRENVGLYKPDVEIINIASYFDLIVDDYGIDSQVYDYADKVYVNYEVNLFSHAFNLKDEDTLKLIYDLLNSNDVDGEETEEGYIIYGKKDILEFHNVYKGEI